MTDGATPHPTILLFGKTGAGKSSIINMLDGDVPATVSSSARGVTTKSALYHKTIDAQVYRIYDTAGLNEGSAGRVPAQAAIEDLHGLMRTLTDGINLLVFVMRGPRIVGDEARNYKMIYETICNKNIPIVIIVTGLEGILKDPDQDEWWRECRKDFDTYGMMFAGHACITARENSVYQSLYMDSQRKVETLIKNEYSHKPWRMPERSWISNVITQVLNFLGFQSSDFNTDLFDLLMEHGLTKKEAKKIANKMPKRK
ncbi:hypothetical protein B0H34DRAFT_731902 [Crassisporium funariophilum]|nr:hypothetical protein B0H34DRAFT_731902 [Crassisporium funariophilum]